MTDHQYPQPTPIGDWNRLLEGRVAVVTGGGTGIGGAISRLFAQHGAIVEIIDIDATVAGEAVAEGIGKSKREAEQSAARMAYEILATLK